MKHLHSLPLITLTALAFVACDSKQENARENTVEKQADAMEDKADATRKGAEAKADAIEDTKAGTTLTNPARDGADAAADATRKTGEKAADALEDKADAARETK